MASSQYVQGWCKIWAKGIRSDQELMPVVWCLRSQVFQGNGPRCGHSGSIGQYPHGVMVEFNHHGEYSWCRELISMIWSFFATLKSLDLPVAITLFLFFYHVSRTHFVSFSGTFSIWVSGLVSEVVSGVLKPIHNQAWVISCMDFRPSLMWWW